MNTDEMQLKVINLGVVVMVNYSVSWFPFIVQKEELYARPFIPIVGFFEYYF